MSSKKTSSSSGASSTTVRVAVRVRPFLAREIRRECKAIVRMKDTATFIRPALVPGSRRSMSSATGAEKRFNFDFSFWSHTGLKECGTDESSEVPEGALLANNQTIFEMLGREVIDNALKGLNATLFAYGQTGSGKSFSMMGGNRDGLIPLICQELFQQANERGDVRIEVTYLEIYNERVKDLLDPRKKHDALRVRSHPTTGPYVEGLSRFAVRDYDHVEQLLDLGNQSRTVGSTAMNDQSSRSHSVFTLAVTESHVDSDTGETMKRSSLVNLVDLAGSERADRTGAQGQRLREGANINRSLSALGKVISVLADVQPGGTAQHVPYRDSVLTWLLCQSLGGNAKTIMLANISPSDDDYEETLSTLRYAERAKRIVTKAVVNESKSARMVAELKAEIERLREALTAARDTSNNDTSLAEQLRESERMWEETRESWEQRLMESNAALEQRSRQLKELGIASSLSGEDCMLVNLNEDPLMSECLVYSIPAGRVTRVGRDDAGTTQDIRLDGLGIDKEHCLLDYTSPGGRVTITPVANALTFVNGERLTSTRELLQFDRVILGQIQTFRFQYPLSHATPTAEAAVKEEEEEEEEGEAGEAGEGQHQVSASRSGDRGRTTSFHSASGEAEPIVAGEVVDWNYARRELMQARDTMALLLAADQLDSSVYTLSPAERRELEEELVGIFNLTNEANAISQALRRAVVFEPVLSGGGGGGGGEGARRPSSGRGAASTAGVHHGRPHAGVRVTQLDTDRKSVWSQEKFRGRMYAIRELWLQASLDGGDSVLLETTQRDGGGSGSGAAALTVAATSIGGADDPFDDVGEDKLVGRCHLFLRPLHYGVDVTRALSIIDMEGRVRGQLHVNLRRHEPRANRRGSKSERKKNGAEAQGEEETLRGVLKKTNATVGVSRKMKGKRLSFASEEREIEAQKEEKEEGKGEAAEEKEEGKEETEEEEEEEEKESGEEEDATNGPLVELTVGDNLVFTLSVVAVQGLTAGDVANCYCNYSMAVLRASASDDEQSTMQPLSRLQNTRRETVRPIGAASDGHGALLNHSETVTLAVSEAMLKEIQRAAIVLEVRGEVGPLTSRSATASSGVVAEGHQAVVHYHASPALLELNGNGDWEGVPFKPEVRGGRARKMFRVHHGQQRQMSLDVSWRRPDTNEEEEKEKVGDDNNGDVLPAYAVQGCRSLRVRSVHEVKKDTALGGVTTGSHGKEGEMESEGVELPLESCKVDQARGVCSIVGDWDAVSRAFRVLRRPTSSGCRVFALVEAELELSAQTPVPYITLAKELCIKVYPRDAEFNTDDDETLFGRQGGGGEASTASAALRLLDWQFEVDIVRTGPKGFIVEDAHEGASAVLRAHADNVRTHEAAMLVERYQQELELMRTLRVRGGRDDFDSQISLLSSNLGNIGDAAAAAAGSAGSTRTPQLTINEVRSQTSPSVLRTMLLESPSGSRKRSTKAITHARTGQQLRDVLREYEREQRRHRDTRERLFAAQMLSVKLELAHQGVNIHNASINDLYDCAVRDNVPVKFWSLWIQIQLGAYELDQLPADAVQFPIRFGL